MSKNHNFTQPIQHLSNSLKYQHRSSPPFRLGGRGSKQLTKALQQSEEIHSSACEAGLSDSSSSSGLKWVLCTSSPVCFAKVVSESSPDKTMIQPLRLHHIDSSLLIPWEGHVWLAKNEHLVPVQMKKEALGYRIQMTPFIRQWIETLNKSGVKSSYPISLQTAIAKKNDDWDMVSLESSEMEDGNSVVFPFLNMNSNQSSCTLKNLSTQVVPSSVELPALLPNIEESSDTPVRVPIEWTASIELSAALPNKAIEIKNSGIHDEILNPQPPDNITTDEKAGDKFTEIKENDSSKTNCFSVNDNPIDSLPMTPQASKSELQSDLSNFSAATTNSAKTGVSHSLHLIDIIKSRSNSIDGETDDSLSQHSYDTDPDMLNLLSQQAIKQFEVVQNQTTSLNQELQIKAQVIPKKLSPVDGIAIPSEKPKKRKRATIDVVQQIPPRPSRSRSLTYQERESVFGTWVSRKQSAANGSWHMK